MYVLPLPLISPSISSLLLSILDKLAAILVVFKTNWSTAEFATLLTSFKLAAVTLFTSATLVNVLVSTLLLNVILSISYNVYCNSLCKSNSSKDVLIGAPNPSILALKLINSSIFVLLLRLVIYP